jgi:hypothetical protein
MLPIGRPRPPMGQDAYRAQMEGAYASTQQVPAFDPSRAGGLGGQGQGGEGQGGEGQGGDLAAKLRDLAELHRSGSLTDEEFSAAKAVVLGGDAGR